MLPTYWHSIPLLAAMKACCAQLGPCPLSSPLLCSLLSHYSRLRALAVAGVPPPTNASCEWRRAVHLLSLFFFFSWPGPTVCRQPCSRLLRLVLRHSVPSSESGAVCTQVHKRGTWQVSSLVERERHGDSIWRPWSRYRRQNGETLHGAHGGLWR